MTQQESEGVAYRGARASNAATEAILGRRSIREGFTAEAVPIEVLEEIVACGLAAPSSKNAQPWRLHIVADRKLLTEMADTAAASEGADTYTPRDPLTGAPWPNWDSTVELSGDVLRDCAVGIFIENLGIFSRGRKTLAAVPTSHLVGSLVGYTFEVLGVGTAVENMWIAATALGLRGSFLGDIVIAEDTIREHLALKGDLVGVLALGYTQADPEWVKEINVGDPNKAVWH